jgi:hypothetical protein
MYRLFTLLFLFYSIQNFAQPNLKAEAESAVKKQFKNPDKIVWIKHFRGQMDELNDVLIALGSDGRDVRGTLEYLESKTVFRLEGTLAGAEFSIKEIDAKGQTSGKLLGKLEKKGLRADWMNAAATLSMRLDAAEIAAPNRETADCGAGKWLRRYESTDRGQVVELTLMRESGGKMRGSIWLPNEKKTRFLTGKLLPSGDFNLFLKKTGAESVGNLSGKLEETGTSQPVKLSIGAISNTLIFRQIESFQTGCQEWAEYSTSFDCLFPKTKNESVNSIFSKKTTDWMNQCRDLQKLKSGDLNPASRASARATGWAEIVCWNERLFCGFQHFGGIEAAGISSSEAFNFDLETGRDVRIEDVFTETFDFAKFVEPILQKEKANLATEASTAMLKKWVETESFNLRTFRREGLAFSTRFSPLFGQPTVVIPWSIFRSYLKSDAVVAPFAR